MQHRLENHIKAKAKEEDEEFEKHIFSIKIISKAYFVLIDNFKNPISLESSYLMCFK